MASSDRWSVSTSAGWVTNCVQPSDTTSIGHPHCRYGSIEDGNLEGFRWLDKMRLARVVFRTFRILPSGDVEKAPFARIFQIRTQIPSATRACLFSSRHTIILPFGSYNSLQLGQEIPLELSHSISRTDRVVPRQIVRRRVTG